MIALAEKPLNRCAPHARLSCVPRVVSLAMVLVYSFAAGANLNSNDALNWKTLPAEPYPKKRDDVVFINRQIGFYGTGQGNLYQTDDGGLSWHLAWMHEGTFIRSLGFVDRQNGFLGNLGIGLGSITDPNPLYRTLDGGASWQPVASAASLIAGVCSIDILKSHEIYEGDVKERTIIHAAGRANGPAQLLRSEDGGDTWTLIDLSDRAGMILDVKFLDPDTGLVFAGTSSDVKKSHALILRTSDAGHTWHEVYRSPRGAEIIWKASFPTNRTGYATIQHNDAEIRTQHIAKSTDFGRHWIEISLVQDPSAQELGIGFVDERHGWVGTTIGGFETLDGGISWRPSGLAPRANRIRTRTVDDQPLVYAIGSEIQIYSPRGHLRKHPGNDILSR
jgi:photosystem II stability/assembly factor-like uncharacterized protein